MKYYLLNPEVAGELGENSEIIYENGKIKEVVHLEYNFIGWLGDELLSTHPCHIVTKKLQNDIVKSGLTGVKFKEMEVSFSEEFYDICEYADIPEFIQMVCNVTYEDNVDDLREDFYCNKYRELIVSERALEVLKIHNIKYCSIEILVSE